MDRDWDEKRVSDSHEFSIMTTLADLSRRCFRIIVGIHTAFFLSAGVYVLALDKYRWRWSCSRKWTPGENELLSFDDVNESPLFECILLGQFVYEFSLVSMAGTVNALLVTLVSNKVKIYNIENLFFVTHYMVVTIFHSQILHVGGQIDIMRQEATRKVSDNSNSTVIEIKNLIFRHQKIINLSDDIENLFLLISLMQFLWNTLIICCSGFMIIIVNIINCVSKIFAVNNPLLFFFLSRLIL